jgi:Lrp/AsnC family transcriptional regulator
MLDSPTAEQTVLGALMLKPDLLASAAAKLDSHILEELPHRSILDAIRSLREAEKPIDELTIAEEMKSAGDLVRLNGKGGASYLTILKASVVVCEPENIAYHVAEIERQWARREMSKILATRSVDVDRDKDIYDLIDRTQVDLERISRQETKASSPTASPTRFELIDIADIPEIVEAHRLTGNHDYILKIVLPRVEHYDVIYKQIVRRLELFDVSASISMEELKHGMAIPVGYVR